MTTTEQSNTGERGVDEFGLPLEPHGTATLREAADEFVAKWRSGDSYDYLSATERTAGKIIDIMRTRINVTIERVNYRERRYSIGSCECTRDLPLF
jgi:hypothetical protein